MSQNFLEKLQLKDEKNLLIQGLPSSIEKQFAKLAFAKNLTPLLKMRRIDFALVFAVNEVQLGGIVKEVLPALREDAKFWVAYPKTASKIATTLNRDCTWQCLVCAGYHGVSHVALDHVWTALRFEKRQETEETLQETCEEELIMAGEEEEVMMATPLRTPADFAKELQRSKIATHFFNELSVNNKKEYLSWINSAKKEETRSRRLESAIGKLIAGKKTPGIK